VDAHELSLAGEISGSATLELLALPGNEMNLARGVLEGHTCELENNSVVTPE
jgi:hypothetical protein